MRGLKRAAVAAVGLIAFSGIGIGAAQAADTPPPGTDYTVTGVSNCDEAIAKSEKDLGTPHGISHYSCMMNADGKSADMQWVK